MDELVQVARMLVGVGRWRWNAFPENPPIYFDCSSLVRWLYSQRGIILPRKTINQIKAIEDRKDVFLAEKGDLLFVSSPYHKGAYSPNTSSLHVGLVTGNGTIVCATNSELGSGVVEVEYERLFKTREFRAVGSVILQV